MSDSKFLLASQLAPIHFALQESENAPTPDRLAEIGTASRRYLTAMKEIDSMSDTPGLKVLIEIWELIEIMLIDFRVKGKMMIGQLLEDLLSWSCQNNSVAAELEMKAINSVDQFNCPEYWDLICSYLLTGNLNHASELLQHHPDYSDTNATLSLINLFIRRRPIFSELGTNADFEAAFNQWQNDVVDSIKDLDFDRYPGVEKIAGILAGDETTLDSCLPLVGQWYRLLIAKCFYLCPTTDPRLMINSSNIEGQSKDHVLVDLINRIFELETTQIIRDLVTLNDSWWLVAHNADLLYKLESDNLELKKLRDNCLSNYIDSLLADKDTWMIGLRYAALMEDFDKIQEEILNCDINSNKEATKIYSIPSRLGLPNATLLKNKIASKYARQQLEMNNRGTALCWALKARDAEICSKIAEYELECFHSTETWSIPALVDAMENNSNNIYSEKLLFLSKYKQFYTRVQGREFYEAAQDLISILACEMSSEILSIVLKQALLLLDEDFTFSRNQIICIMRALQKQKESSRLANVKLNPTEIEQANLLRKSLAHHLSRSIIQHSS